MNMGITIEIIAVDGHKLSAYLAEPSGPPKGGTVVLQEIFGVNSHIGQMADEFARDGYLALAAVVFDRAERGVEPPTTPPEWKRAEYCEPAS
jgi:carboxymethylenebutenolidase